MAPVHPEAPPLTYADLFSRRAKLTEADVGAWQQVQAPALRKYRPWRKFRHVANDMGVDPVVAWRALKAAWLLNATNVPLSQPSGDLFVLAGVPELYEALHRVDRATGGGGPALLQPQGALGDENILARLRVKTWMDEAAESSLIEGASGTRKQATDLIRSGRTPMTTGERMIVNNYAAMQKIKTWLDRDLSINMLTELQAILTRDTLENADESGRLRRQDEPVHVVDERTGAIIYTPPPADSLPLRLGAMCHFANTDHRGEAFIHPLIKACILHFMIGFEHPFCDGNGRTARAIFYWYALKHGYRVFEFMPISERIRAGYARYPRAYLDTEIEGGDLTHFVLYHLKIIEQAYDRLEEHLRQEEVRHTRAQQLLSKSKDLNLRQRILLEHALRHPSQVYTVASHANSNSISLNTARADLEALVRRKLFITSKIGKEVQYHPAPGLERKVLGPRARR